MSRRNAQGPMAGTAVVVVYATKSGSTAGVAEAVGQRLRDLGASVDVRPARDVPEVDAYDAVIVGSPVLYGKPHREAVDFLGGHQQSLRRIPVACFLTCMELTTDAGEDRHGVPVWIDPRFDTRPRRPGRSTWFERTHLVSAFLEALLGPVPEIRPVSVGIFRGRLDYAGLDRTSRWAMRFIRLVYRRAPEGDFRNWEAIRAWATSLAAVLPARAPAPDAGRPRT